MKKTVLIDLDETILIGAMKELVEKFLGKEISENDIKPGKYINQIIKDEHFKEFLITNNLYEYGNIPKETIRIIKKLNSKYDVFIGSTYYFPEIEDSSDIILSRKFNFLQKYFSFLGVTKFLFVGSKQVLSFDISIGDSLSDLIGKEKNYLITSYHNKHYKDEDLDNFNAKRVNSWQEIEDLL